MSMLLCKCGRRATVDHLQGVVPQRRQFDEQCAALGTIMGNEEQPSSVLSMPVRARARALLNARAVGDCEQEESFEVLEQLGSDEGITSGAQSPGPPGTPLDTDDGENRADPAAAIAARSAALASARSKLVAREHHATLSTLVDAPEQTMPEEDVEAAESPVVAGAGESMSVPVTPVKGRSQLAARGAVSAKASPMRGMTKPPLSPSRPDLLARCPPASQHQA
jgi:hypothetical protein